MRATEVVGMDAAHDHAMLELKYGRRLLPLFIMKIMHASEKSAAHE
jgi:hypothetical protein